MSKKLSLIGAVCIALIMFCVSGAHALNLSGSSILKCPYPKQYINGVCQSPILVDLSWSGIGNADKTITDFIATLIPNPNDSVFPNYILFRNPGGNTGGTSSVNFLDSSLSVSGGSLLNPFITGKGKANTKTIFGDCDICNAKDGSGNYIYNLPDDGKLWFLFDEQGCAAAGGLNPKPLCGPNAPTDCFTQEENNTYYNSIIECIKMDLVEKYKPNTSWWPYAVEINNLNLMIEAYTDGVLKLTGDFQNCKINSDNEYICDSRTITKH